MATMNSGLGGASGYGENSFKTNGYDYSLDGGTTNYDDSAVQIDVTSVFGPSGIDYFGTNYTDIWINSNGLITFDGHNTSYNPTGVAGLSEPAIVPFWSDIDIDKGGDIYWDIDPTAGTVTITWLDVRAFDGNISTTNSFQLVLTDTGGGDFEVSFIYEDIDWSNGGSGVATAGITDGASNDFEVEGSGNGSDVLAWDANDFDDTGPDPAGVFSLSVVDGAPSVFSVVGTSGDDSMGLGYIDQNNVQITTNDDIVEGGTGNDSIDANMGADTISGGSGNDTILSGSEGTGIISWTSVGQGADLTGTTGQDYYQFTGQNATIRFNNSAGTGDGDGVADYLWMDTGLNATNVTIEDFDIGTDKIVIDQTWSGHSVSVSSGFTTVTLNYSSGLQQDYTIYHQGSFDINDVFTTTQPTGTVNDDDSLSGGDDADTFLMEDSFGADTVLGGEGGSDNDTIDHSALTSAVTVTYSGGEVGTSTDGSDTLTFSEVEGLILTDQNDSVAGQSSDSAYIDAGDGADTISYGNGEVTVLGGDGDDLIEDQSTGISGNDSIEGNAGKDTIWTGEGDDTISGGSGSDLIYAEEGDDSIIGDAGADTIYGGIGADTIDGENGDDSIFGGSGNDYIYDTGGTGSNDTFDGGSGDDTINGGLAADSLFGGDGNDLIDGGVGNDNISGGSGADTILAGDGDDHIDGGDGDDSIDLEPTNNGSGSGNDTIIGGSGTDTLDVGDFNAVGEFGFTGTITDAGFSFTNGTDTISGSGIERFNLTHGGDTIDASAATTDLYIFARDGSYNGINDDIIIGGSGNDTIWSADGHATLTGGAGDDVFQATNGNKVFLFEDGFGADTIDASWDTDRLDFSGLNTQAVSVTMSTGSTGSVSSGSDSAQLEGGGRDFDEFVLSGNADSFDGSSSSDSFNVGGGAGEDTITGSKSNDTLSSGVGADTISGGDGDDQLMGGVGSDRIVGGDGNDIIRGDNVWLDPADYSSSGGSATTLFVTNSADGPIDLWWINGSGTPVYYATIDVGSTHSQATLTNNNWLLRDADGYYLQVIEGGNQTIDYGADGLDDVINGRADSDTIYGEFGNDSITGDEGNDSLYGGTGHDTISGGDGDDYIDGGDGDDYLTTGLGNDTLLGGEGNDTLLNSAGDDSLVGGAGDDSIIATAGNDTLEGGDGADTLDGGSEDDSIVGGSGDDVIYTGLGTDVAFGGDGADTFHVHGAEGVTFNGSGTDGVAIATGMSDFPTDALSFEIQFSSDGTGPGEPTFVSYATSSSNNEFLVYANSSDILQIAIQGTVLDTGASVSSLFDGNPHSLAVTWDSASGALNVYADGASIYSATFNAGDILEQGGTLVFGQEQDNLGGGFQDNQRFQGEIHNAKLFDDVRTPTEIASDAADHEADTSNSNLIAGWVPDADTGGLKDLTGNHDMTMSGDTEVVTSLGGNDTITGGEGGTDDDTIDLSALTGPVTVSYTGDEAGTITDGTYTVTFSEIENIFLTAFDDSVDGSSDTAGFNIFADDGDDTIVGGTGDDSIQSGAGQDVITGGSGADSITNSGGYDTISGDAGDDTITGTGNFEGGDGNDLLDFRGGGGPGVGSYNVGDGGAGNDTLLGADGQNDFFYLSGGTDSFDGGTDQGAGDWISGNRLTEGFSINIDTGTASWGTGNTASILNIEHVDGSAHDDTISGDSNNNFLYGNAGDDSMSGGTGDDNLTGGTGNDVFTYSVGDGHDTISDFNTGNTGTLSDGDNTNNDFIDLSGFYDNLSELYADQTDDGILNQSNTTDGKGRSTDYSDNSEFGASDNLTFQGASADNSSFTQENTGVVCFTSGTAIRTPRGDVLIDDLKVGDLVTTMDNGPQRIRWIGRRDIAQPALLAHPKLRPILIPRGIMGAERDLLISRQHAILIGQDHLARAAHLSNIPGLPVRVANGKHKVTYIHLMFEKHEIVFAEQVPTESFYPGPTAFEMFEENTRRQFIRAFPKFTYLRTRNQIAEGYGEMARPLALRRNIPNLRTTPKNSGKVPRLTEVTLSQLA